MNDIFKEQLVKRKKGAKERMELAAIIVGSLAAMALCSVIPVISNFIVFTTAAVLFVAFLLIQRLNVEYEYALTNRFLDIDKIINKSKRKKIIGIEVTDFELVAPMADEAYSKEFKSCTQTIDCSSGHNHNGNIYAGIVNYEGKRTMLVFEPDDTILTGLKMFIPKKVK